MNDIFNLPGSRPTTQMYYFQLVPNTLTIVNPSMVATAKDSNEQFRLKMVKGVQLCDEMNKYLAVRAIGDKATFEQVHLNFNLLSFNPTRNIQFKLLLLKSHDGKDEIEIGKYSIMSSEFIQEFKNNKVNCFQSNVSMSHDYSLSFQLFIDHTRFALQKAIKEKRNSVGETKIQNVFEHEPIRKGSLYSKPFSENKAYSERMTNFKKVEVGISDGNSFTSSGKRCVRKPMERRRLQKKQSSPIKFQSQDIAKRETIPLTSNFVESPPPSLNTQSLSQQSVERITRKTSQQKEKERQKIETEKKKVEAKKLIQKRLQAQRRKESEQAARKAEEEREKAEEEGKKIKIEEEEKENEKKLREQKKKEDERIKIEEERKKKIESERQRKIEEERNKKEEERRKVEEEKLRKIEVQEKKKIEEQQKRKTEQEEKKRAKAEKIIKEASRQKKSQSGQKTKSKKQISELKPPPQNFLVIPSHSRNENKRYLGRKEKCEDDENRRNEKNIKHNFTSGSVIKKQEWEKPVILKKTGSMLFDQKGNEIKTPTMPVKKQNNTKSDIKSIIIIIVLLIIAFFILANSVGSSRKR